MPALKLFGFALILITLIVVGLSGMLGWRTIRQMGELDTSITRIEAIKALANIQGFISLERGVSTLALTNAGSGDDAQRLAALRQARKNTDEVIAAVLAHIGELAAMDATDASLLPNARELAARVAASRDFCDEQLGRPFAVHGDAARQLINRMNDIIEGARVTGEIKLDGHDIYERDVDVVQLRARVGMVFQKPNPFPKSIYDNVAFGP